MKKLTLGFKETYCQHCKNCDDRAMRQGRPYCNSVYEYRNGHCRNFESKSKKRTKKGEK